MSTTDPALRVDTCRCGGPLEAVLRIDLDYVAYDRATKQVIDFLPSFSADNDANGIVCRNDSRVTVTCRDCGEEQLVEIPVELTRRWSYSGN